MTGNDQQLYDNVLEMIRYFLHQFNPKTEMSDWEIAPRNAIKRLIPMSK